MIPILISSLVLMISFSLILSKLFINYKLFDKINNRSSHQTSALRSGGSALYFVIMLISIYFYLIGFSLFDYSILIPISILYLIGLYDDVYNIDFKLKFIFQIIVAKIMIDNGFLIDNLHGLFGLYEINRIIAQILTIFVVISIINAINFIDGIDGLAISIIAIFIISFEFFSIDNTGFFSLSIIILACLLPSYIFNFRKKNKIFLGDSGSYLLGGITSIYVLNILSQNYIIKPEFDIHKIIFVMSILSYPVIDITRVFILRVYNRKSPFLADKNHLHHLLNKNLNSQAKTTAVIVFFSITSVILVQIFFNQKIPFI